MKQRNNEQKPTKTSFFTRLKEKSAQKDDNRIAFKGGTYSLILSIVVLAVLVAIVVLFALLPSSWTQLDISASRLYSISSSSKAVINDLDEDVTIYWIVQADEEDSVIENLLSKYEKASSHISVVKKNPDVYPTFVEQYTSESVSNNSLIVECGTKSRYIAYGDIYLTEVDYTTYSYTYSFDGEAAITSAIDYVTNEDFPVLYVLEGHGEEELSSDFSAQISKANMEVETLSLLSEGAVPEDADIVLVYAPTSDISADEAKMLSSYVEDGGHLMVMSSPVESGVLTNLCSVLENYDVSPVEGVVVEGDSSHYVFQAPYILLPDVQSSDITNSLLESNYYVVMGVAGGLEIGDGGAGTVTDLLRTSDDAYSKVAGYDIETYDKEEGDIDGSFSLAVLIEDASGGSLVWIGSSYFLDDSYNSYSSGANLELVMNALSSMAGETATVAIPSKSLSSSYLTISDTEASQLTVVMVVVLPLICLAAGIYMLISRKRRARHE